MDITCICLNLWNGGILFDAIIPYLTEQQPDILACQEVYNGHDPKLDPRFRSIDAIQEVFRFPYVTFAPCFTEQVNEAKIEQGNAIFSKFPITDQSTTFFDKAHTTRPENIPKYYEETPRNIQHAAVAIKDTLLHVFNVQGIWGKDGLDNPRRLAMSTTILEAIGTKAPVILTGDLNVREGTETIQRIEGKLHNIFKGEAVTTFNMRRKKDAIFRDAVIDFFFATPDMEIRDHVISDADVSDHLSLITKLHIG